MGKRIVCTIALALIAFICVFSLVSPPTTYSFVIEDENDSTLSVLDSDEITWFNNCSENENGIIVVDDDDPSIVFDYLDTEVASLVLRVAENTDGMSVQTYIDRGYGFNDMDREDSFMCADDTDCVIPVDSELYAVRIDIDEEYSLDALELHSASAVLEAEKSSVSALGWVLCVLAAVVTAVLFFILDKRFDILGKTGAFIKNTYKRAIAIVVGLICSGALAAAVESVLVKLTSSDSFSLYRFVLIFGIFFCVAALIIFRRDMAKKPENAFLSLALTVCIMMLIICPFGHASWDLETHYSMVLDSSSLGFEPYVSRAENDIIKVALDSLPLSSELTNSQRIEKYNEDYMFTAGRMSSQTTVAHWPSGLFLALGRLANLSFNSMTMLSRFANVLVYCFVCYFAIRKLKSGKMIASVIALIPTSIFLTANFSYDYWTICFIMLGMAYFVSAHQNKDETISLRDTLIMCGAFALASVPKLLYAVFCLLPFIMKRKKIENPKRYYAICVLALVFVGGLLIFKSLNVVMGGGDTRGGSDVNTMGQIAFILGNPFGFVRMMLKFLKGYLSLGQMKEFLVNFAYVGIGDFEEVFIALFFVTALTDKDSCDINSVGKLTRATIVCMYLGTSAIIAAALYVAFTPVGLDAVLGCQPRYLIPMLYPLLATVAPGFKSTYNKSFYNYGVLIACVAVNVYNIARFLLPVTMA